MKTCPIDSKKNTQEIKGEKHHMTWDFPRRCRTTAEVNRLKEFHYAEYPEFEKFDYETLKHTPGYLCANCKYMKVDPSSVTGYYCPEVKAPDIPSGCCSAHKLIPDFMRENNPDTLYHVTDSKHLDLIMKEGLKPFPDDHLRLSHITDKKVVNLADKQFVKQVASMLRAGDWLNTPVFIKVDVRGIPLQKIRDDWYYSEVPIPMDRLLVIGKEI